MLVKTFKFIFFFILLISGLTFAIPQKALAATTSSNIVETVDKAIVGWDEVLTYKLVFENKDSVSHQWASIRVHTPPNTTFIVGSNKATVTDTNGALIRNGNSAESYGELVFKGGGAIQPGQKLVGEYKVKTKSPVLIKASIMAGDIQQAGYPVNFDATRSLGTNRIGGLDNFGIEKYKWEFNDGSADAVQESPYLPTITHTFPGGVGTIYNVKLTVTDYIGRQASTTKTITMVNLPVYDINNDEYDPTVKCWTEAQIDAMVPPPTKEEIYRNRYICDYATRINDVTRAHRTEPIIIRLPETPHAYYTDASGNRIKDPITNTDSDKGAYSESVIELQAGHILEGRGIDKTIITKRGGNDVVFKVYGNNVRITNLQSGGRERVDRPNLVHQSVYRNTTVDNCYFRYHNDTNWSGGYSTATYHHNVIYDTDVDGAGYGLQAGVGDYLVARNNVFRRNRHAFSAAGATDIYYQSYNTGYDAFNNVITDLAKNYPDASMDVHMTARGRFRIVGNTFDAVGGWGIHDGWGEVKNNTFKNMWATTAGAAANLLLFEKSNIMPGGTSYTCSQVVCYDVTGAGGDPCDVCAGAHDFIIENNNFENITFNSGHEKEGIYAHLYRLDFNDTNPMKGFKIDGCEIEPVVHPTNRWIGEPDSIIYHGDGLNTTVNSNWDKTTGRLVNCQPVSPTSFVDKWQKLAQMLTKNVN